jgi:hypothetical protein
MWVRKGERRGVSSAAMCSYHPSWDDESDATTVATAARRCIVFAEKSCAALVETSTLMNHKNNTDDVVVNCYVTCVV